MKKIYLTMLALLAFASSNAQSTDPEWATQEMNAIFTNRADVVALKSSEFPKGSGEVKIPICVKAHADFQGTSFYIQLPNDLRVKKLEPVVDARMVNLYDGDNYHQGQLQDDENKTYKVVSSMGGSTSSGGKAYYTKGEASDDYLFTYITVDISSLTTPGDYPMKIVTETIIADFADGSEDVIYTDEITTTLKITDEVILDEMYTTYPGTYEDVKVRVRRTISAGNWNSICLPFAMTAEQCQNVFGEGVKIADFVKYDTTWDDDDNVISINVRFNEVHEIEANHPYIIKVNNKIEEFVLDGVDITPIAIGDNPDNPNRPTKDWDNGKTGTRYQWYGSYIGTYVNETILDNTNYLFLSGNKFYYSNGATKMKGYRAYFDFDDILADKTQNISTSKIRFEIGGEATSIDGITSAEKIKGVYTVSGVKVAEDSLEGLPKGVYIVNGKKVLVK